MKIVVFDMKRIVSIFFVIVLVFSTLSVSTSATTYDIYCTIDTTKSQLKGYGKEYIYCKTCNCQINDYTVKLVSGKKVVDFNRLKNGQAKLYYKKAGTGIYRIKCAKGHYTYYKVIVRPCEMTITFDMSIPMSPYEMSIRDWYYNAKTVSVPARLGFAPVTIIQPKCFSGNDKIEVIKIPSSVKYIEKSAFDDLPNLKKVIVNGKTFTKSNLYKIWLSSTWKNSKYEITELPSTYELYENIKDGKTTKSIYDYFN